MGNDIKWQTQDHYIWRLHFWNLLHCLQTTVDSFPGPRPISNMTVLRHLWEATYLLLDRYWECDFCLTEMLLLAWSWLKFIEDQVNKDQFTSFKKWTMNEILISQNCHFENKNFQQRKQGGRFLLLESVVVVHGWDQVKVWILKGENSHSIHITKPFLLLSERYMNPEIWP